jgi:glutathione peroxidase
MSTDIYNIPLKTIEGADTDLGAFRGKVLLIVNVASKCGLTPQYEGLQRLYSGQKDKGFEVLAFPANNYLGQEPGSEDEIKDFCSTNYSVSFPMFAKLSTKGDDQHPLYKYLTDTKPETDVNDGGLEERLKGYQQFRSTPSEVLWNFEKFLVDRSGNIVARFAPDVAPDDARLLAKIDELL